MDPKDRWIVTVDARRASLVAFRRNAGGGLHAEPTRSLENEHSGEHAHQRPTLLSGAERSGSLSRSGASAAPHSVAPGHGPDEELRRFARDVAGWMAKASRELRIERLSAFAAPRMLGLLRAHADEIGPGTELIAGDLAQLNSTQLCEHPAVLGALQGSAASGRR